MVAGDCQDCQRSKDCWKRAAHACDLMGSPLRVFACLLCLLPQAYTSIKSELASGAAQVGSLYLPACSSASQQQLQLAASGQQPSIMLPGSSSSRGGADTQHSMVLQGSAPSAAAAVGQHHGGADAGALPGAQLHDGAIHSRQAPPAALL